MVARLAAAGRASTARAVAVTWTVRPPGTSRTRRLTFTTAWMAEQSHLTSSAPLATAISAARDVPQPGVRAARAAMSAAVCAAARAAASAPMSTARTPVIRMSPDNANPMRVAPPFSPADHPNERAGPARTCLGRAAATRGVFTGWPGSAVGQARWLRPRWP